MKLDKKTFLCFNKLADSMLMLVQCWANVGISVGPTLAATIPPMVFGPVEEMFVQCRQAKAKNSTQSIASANQIAASCYIGPLFNRR